MRSGGQPAASARFISPVETTSMPAPWATSVRSTARLELALAAKQTAIGRPASAST